ncbi:DNA-binding HxlR family transcriptional regulator [Algoriphagus sp. 4150]|uniref:winged helix-turn-helix transcriptional regulator n=1 Tax=Algoriphagus sp. 4150 TaxID=2817756 RepID=UPI0028616E92|nr:helix-turn-helix domain-containing protein [Algoriphagus sp. 4150]MDR7129527.1 DNA-binding HxlR family transcriptional regulator [Algoriphagus sp. 4150]
MPKKTSTNYENQERIIGGCGMAFTLALIGGRWKPGILYQLLNTERMRFAELKNQLKGISERILASKLKELEKDGLISRVVFPEVPPRVEYEMTEKGNSLKTMLETMSDWGELNRDN